MKKIALTLAMTAAIMLSGNIPVSAADTAKIGYGQGVSADEKNRPTDAVQFNSRYSGIDAYALTEDEKRIILTFDQGYENGYTDNSKTVKVVVTVDNPPNDVQPDDDNNGGKSFLDIITGIYSKLMEFFRQIFALFGISI